MSQLSRTEWEALYGTTGTVFPDNTTGEISEGDMRTFGKNASDSIPFTRNDSYTWAFPKADTSGTNTYAVTLSPAITAYTNGMKIHVKIKTASTGASTLNANTVGARKIFLAPSTQADSGDLIDEQEYIMSYDSALDAAVGGWLIIGGGGGGGGAVDSVNGQTGVVQVNADDVPFTPAGNLSATDVQAALEELDSEKVAEDQIIGIQDVNIPAAAMWPRGTDGCAPLTNYSMATSLLDVMALRFGLTGAEYAQTHFTLPRKWNNGTITYQIKWKPEAAGTGDVRFAVQGAAYSNDDALTGAFGTAVAVVDTYIAADDLHVTPVSGALTISGTPAAGDLVALQVSRDPGHTDDTFTQGALFIDITLFITTTAAIDA